ADEVRVLGEQVDDLALAFVTPLRPDDDGPRHGPKCARSVGYAAGAESLELGRRGAVALAAPPPAPLGGRLSPLLTGRSPRRIVSCWACSLWLRGGACAALGARL